MWQCAAFADHLEIVERVTGIGQQSRNRFSSVNGTSATEADDEIDPGRARCRYPFHHGVHSRLRVYVENGRFEPGTLKASQR
jgi:hypothetical protein